MELDLSDKIKDFVSSSACESTRVSFQDRKDESEPVVTAEGTQSTEEKECEATLLQAQLDVKESEIISLSERF